MALLVLGCVLTSFRACFLSSSLARKRVGIQAELLKVLTARSDSRGSPGLGMAADEQGVERLKLDRQGHRARPYTKLARKLCSRSAPRRLRCVMVALYALYTSVRNTRFGMLWAPVSASILFGFSSVLAKDEHVGRCALRTLHVS